MSATTANDGVSTAMLDDPTALVGIDTAETSARYSAWRGLNYHPDRTTKDVAAIVRRHLRAAVRAGHLGSATAVAVRYRSFAGGSAIDVAVTVPQRRCNADTPGAVQLPSYPGGPYADIVWCVPDGNAAAASWAEQLEPGARDAQAKADAFVRSFNRDDSSRMPDDHCSVEFFADVTIVEAS